MNVRFLSCKTSYKQEKSIDKTLNNSNKDAGPYIEFWKVKDGNIQKLNLTNLRVWNPDVDTLRDSTETPTAEVQCLRGIWSCTRVYKVEKMIPGIT
jgi:hypothetical protein